MRIKSPQSSPRKYKRGKVLEPALARPGSSLPGSKRGGDYLSRDLQESFVWSSHARLRCRLISFRRAHNIWQALFVGDFPGDGLPKDALKAPKALKQAAGKCWLGEESSPQRLKSNSLHSSYVRPKGRTLEFLHLKEGGKNKIRGMREFSGSCRSDALYQGSHTLL
jgi:hypothetical protein